MAALFDHYAPYAEADAVGSFLADRCPTISQANQVLSYADLKFIAVAPLSGMIAVEFGYAVAWDAEHLLGVRFRNGRLLELCGSALPP
ncbi:DUF6985 domain-containing protein [Methylomonas koyamae]|uniref:DUF6985 domain-containing protein n=1 Tax=Methylomonas koyamae TaxID=702114 RepID=A0AA91DDV2_9GAMM|nr:hypothetical protein [Methylomonas koyamae]OAI26394.1 hypothetical protein A1356_11310 [Methylomonas koyamae]